MRTIEESISLVSFFLSPDNSPGLSALSDLRRIRLTGPGRYSPCLRSWGDTLLSAPLAKNYTLQLRRLPGYMLFIIGMSSLTILMTTGPTDTTKSEGRIQKKIGKTSFTPSLAAFSSAICRACTRM